MKKHLFFLFAFIIVAFMSSCENQSVEETENLYSNEPIETIASDKDEEPDH